jgi:hypothetical protein
MLDVAVRDRLLAETPLLRVEDAAQLQALIASGALPAAGQSAFVVPKGLRGGPVQSATMPFVQTFEETVSVVLALRSAQPDAERAKAELSALLDGVIPAIVGWQAPGAIDAFRLVRGQIISLTKGVLLYEIEFATSAQLRIVQ